MSHDFKLKRLATRSLDAALEKARHYRDLNQPEEAESICRDILAEDPDHQVALKILGLALTDRLADFKVGLFEEAIGVFSKLQHEFDRIYHQGVAWERLAKAHLRRNEAHSALTSLEHALAAYQRAEEIGPADSPDAILRWNCCVRMIECHPSLTEAMESEHSHAPGLGD